MGDSRLHRCRRAWEATRSFEDEVAYLRERLRTGELSSGLLQDAADHGHMSARFVLGDKRIPLDEPSTRDPWLTLRELHEYTAWARVSSPEDFAWRFGGHYLVQHQRGRSPLVTRVSDPEKPELRVVVASRRDLGPWQGFQTVPRHGEFMTNEEGVLLYTDLGESADGSYLEGVRLPSLSPVPVQAGAQLTLASELGEVLDDEQLYARALGG